MPIITPEQFFSDVVPYRVIGLEGEYKPQGNGKAGYISHEAIKAAGHRHVGKFLDNGGAVYFDVRHLEYDTPECLGPKQAAAADLAGAIILGEIVTASNLKHRGIYRMTGSYMPDPEDKAGHGFTNGFHENFMFPLALAFNARIDTMIPSFLASDLLSMNGTLRDGFSFSQKIGGIGGKPIERIYTRMTTPGNKPMAIVRVSDDDTVGPNDWVRLEVRYADAGLNGDERFRRLGAVSLMLRMLEHEQLVGTERLQSISLKEPVRAAQIFAADLTMRQTVLTNENKEVNATDVQEAYAEIAMELREKVGLPDDEDLAAQMWHERNEKLKAARPDQAEYGELIQEADVAAKHTAVSRGRSQEALTSTNKEAMKEILLWDRILPKGVGQMWWEHFPSKVVTAVDVETMRTTVPLTRANRRTRYIKNECVTIEAMNWAALSGTTRGALTGRFTVEMNDPYQSED